MQVRSPSWCTETAPQSVSGPPTRTTWLLALGTPGSITVGHEAPGVWGARCRFRGHDGVTRRLRKHGASKSAARAELHKAIEEPQRGTSRAGDLSPGSTFADASEVYLARVARKREDTTRVEYRARLDNDVLPALGALRLRECTVAQLNRIEQPREKRRTGPRGLTVEERRALLEWLDASSPDPAARRIQGVARRAELPDLVRFFLGTGKQPRGRSRWSGRCSWSSHRR